MSDYDEVSLEKNVIEVKGPSGSLYSVIHESEKDYWEESLKKYMNDYKFTNASDLQDLDRVLMTEMLLFRYNQWISLECDYWGGGVDVLELNKIVKDKSSSLDVLKKSIGINKSSRDKDQGDDVASYVENLRRRAHEFGVKRNEEAVKAISLFHELIAMLTFHDNCDSQERREERIDTDDLLNWLRDTAIPEFLEIDKNFRETKQKYWINEM